jgi:hypothetical protein
MHVADVNICFTGYPAHCSNQAWPIDMIGKQEVAVVGNDINPDSLTARYWVRLSEWCRLPIHYPRLTNLQGAKGW